MIARAVEYLRASMGRDPAVSHAGSLWTYDQLSAAGARIAARLEHLRGANVGASMAHVPLHMATFLALDRIDATAVLYPSASPPAADRLDDLDVPLAELLLDTPDCPSDLARELDASQPDPPAELAASRGRVVLFTSGTSGRPKPALHTWHSLSAAVRRHRKLDGRRWLLSYDVSRFAGLQVMLQALLTGGQLCVPSGSDPDAVLRTLVDDGVQCASATPTFWRMLLGAAAPSDLARCRLKQITLGGEAADQPVLDALASAFPQARICHIYASTEMGACFTVRDGRAGFPASYLSSTSLPCQLQVADDGELLIRSTRAMHQYLAGETADDADWFATGDMVRVEGDRVYIQGRKSECINVGGAKVYPAVVEAVIRSVPGVLEVYVHRIASSLVGELVAADVRADAAASENELRGEILSACRRRLAKFQVPAQITFTKEMNINESGKLARIR